MTQSEMTGSSDGPFMQMSSHVALAFKDFDMWEGCEEDSKQGQDFFGGERGRSEGGFEEGIRCELCGGNERIMQ